MLSHLDRALFLLLVALCCVTSVRAAKLYDKPSPVADKAKTTTTTTTTAPPSTTSTQALARTFEPSPTLAEYLALYRDLPDQALAKAADVANAALALPGTLNDRDYLRAQWSDLVAKPSPIVAACLQLLALGILLVSLGYIAVAVQSTLVGKLRPLA
jgi:hypothetical protein